MKNTAATSTTKTKILRAPWMSASPAMRVSGLAVAAVLAISACAEMEPGQRGAATGAAIGSGIALVSGGGAAAVIGGGLIGGGVGYVGGSAAGRR